VIREGHRCSDPDAVYSPSIVALQNSTCPTICPTSSTDLSYEVSGCWHLSPCSLSICFRAQSKSCSWSLLQPGSKQHLWNVTNLMCHMHAGVIMQRPLCQAIPAKSSLVIGKYTSRMPTDVKLPCAQVNRIAAWRLRIATCVAI
jgi:hypothetical protein